jgi:hypothetical protein
MKDCSTNTSTSSASSSLSQGEEDSFYNQGCSSSSTRKNSRTSQDSYSMMSEDETESENEEEEEGVQMKNNPFMNIPFSLSTKVQLASLSSFASSSSSSKKQQQQQSLFEKQLLMELDQFQQLIGSETISVQRIGLPFRQELHREEIRSRQQNAREILNLCQLISEQTLVN